jgi:hypothetical protein
MKLLNLHLQKTQVSAVIINEYFKNIPWTAILHTLPLLMRICLLACYLSCVLFSQS